MPSKTRIDRVLAAVERLLRGAGDLAEIAGRDAAVAFEGDAGGFGSRLMANPQFSERYYPDKFNPVNKIRIICAVRRLDFPASGWHDQARREAPCSGGIAMLTVHHLNNSRSQRVLWLLEELGVPYEIVRYQRQPDMRAPAELRAIHPLGKSPVITDNGNTIAESGAIAEYIIDTYGNGRLIPPPKTPERLRYTYWLHYAEGSAMPPLLLKLLFTLMPKRAPALLRPLVRKVSNQALTTLVNPQLKQHMAYWEGELAKKRVVRRQ